MTFTGVMDQVRAVVYDDADSEAAQTLSDDVFVLYLNDGMRRIFELRPDSRITSTGTLNAWADASAAAPSTALVIADTYQPALVEFCAYRYFNRDAGDTRDKVRAGEHYKNFQSLLTQGV